MNKVAVSGRQAGISVKNAEELYTLEASTHSAAETVREQIEELRRRIASRGLDVLKSASVVATTLAKCYMSSEMVEQRFDVAIVDEASMAPMPMVFFAVSLCKNKAVIVGDFRQLPPIAQAETEAAAKWLKRDIFAFMGVDGEREQENLALLDVQYRMHPAIASIANLLVYEGKLKNGTRAISRPYHEPLGVLALVDTGDVMPRCWRTEDFTRFNLLNILLCAAIRNKLNHQGLKGGELGVIAPYRAQAKLLRKLFADMGDEDTICSTVHKFQGREKDAIIFDSTDSYPEKIGRLLRGPRDSDGGKVLNVALTRPKDVLVLIANVGYVETNGTSASQLLNVLSEIKRAGNTIQAQSQLPQEFQDVINGNDERARAKFGAADLELFIEDAEQEVAASLLQQARTRRVVVIPRIVDPRQVPLDALTAPKSDGQARSFVITRKSGNHAIRSKLENSGVQLVEAAVDIRLVAGDASMLMIPDVGRCLDGTPFGLTFYNAANTVEELLKLTRVHRLLRELEDKSNPIQYLDQKRLGRSCPSCGSELKVIVAQYGPFVACANPNRSCAYKERISDGQIEELLPGNAKVCANGHPMIVKRSWKGERKGVPFLGCSQYPSCRSTKSLSRGR